MKTSKNSRELKPGQVDLKRARDYWMHSGRDEQIRKAKLHAAREDGIRFACHMLIDQLPKDARSYKWAKEQADLCMKYFCENAPDAAQEFFDREAPKALDKYLDDLRQGNEVVREPEGRFPVKGSVRF